jgi:uncharacterized DUF497 family protein
MSLDVEWDPEKAASNASKHGVTFQEAATVLADPLAITLLDQDHSIYEERLLLLGQSEDGRYLIVSITELASVVRIISARPMTSRERRTYDQATGT